MIEFLTALLVIITGVYAYLTYRMARSSEATLESMAKPYVTVSPFIRPHTTFLYLRIANTGRCGANNLRLSLDRDFFQFAHADDPDRNLKTKVAFSEPISCLAPGAELIFGLGAGHNLFGHDANESVCPTRFTVQSAFEFNGKVVTETHRVDLRPYIGTEGERSPLVEELERLRKEIEKAR